MKKDCLFCQIIAQEIPSHKIYENEFVYAFLDIFPNSNGHTLVIPKVHSEYYTDTSDKYLSEVAIAAKKIAQQIYQTLKPEGINFISNEKELAFQQVFHYHLHIVPKYEKNKGYNFNLIPDQNSMQDLATIKNLLEIK
ncbi:histidine triad protein [Spiroplasma syrphidicola EA-1]|uniref:Histidine triad protein n=1 Tax=Spiroplasma syrphidicola EA-1 TaxID=1276229 RepID=R4UF61_9MOLU|nr:HIT family protein [Spiroplasma syrphidicola]AGM26549.1 histidine triad protein [Spiroplasma syrphidicola EA-1]